MALLSICDLTIRFGANTVVDRLTLSMTEGESVGLVGESGSGKSVTALAVLRLLPPSAQVFGAIHYRPGVDAPLLNLLTLAPESMRLLRGSAIGMIFQEPMTSLNPVMPVGEQIAEAIRAHQPRLGRREVRERTLTAMEAVALPDPLRRSRDYPHQFSGGQRQRILIAMAIVNDPRLLIADEPTTALDVTVQAQILELLESLRERYRLAMLFISHDLAVVSRVSDRLAVMRHGVLLEEGPAQAIFAAPRHPYTQSLLGAIPTMRTDLVQPLAVVNTAARSALQGVLREIEPGHWVRA